MSLNFSVFHTINFASSQQIFTSDNEPNVTKDMIILLSNLTELFRERNEVTSSIFTDQLSDLPQQNDSSLIYTYTDPGSIELGGIVLLENSSRLVYQTNPFFIAEGHLSSNLPCDNNNFSKVNILGGKIPSLRLIPLEPVYEFSDPGRLCTYQVSLSSNATYPISQIVIQNNSTEEILLPLSSKILIGVSELAKNNTIN